VNAGTPFVVIADAHDWLLLFFESDTRARHAGSVKLGKISALCLIVFDPQVNAVLRRDLLLEREKEVPLNT
jgi:hypothetical protein